MNSSTYATATANKRVFVISNSHCIPPDPKPIKIPIAILSRATPKVIATPAPMLIP